MTPSINFNGIVVIVGNYGSGKTEVAVNLALEQKKKGKTVVLADLDLVNPYFRSREAAAVLNRHGIEVVLPPGEYFHADLPILTPAVSGCIKNGQGLVILDVGGDDAGATVLAALRDAFADQVLTVLQVVNPFRPYTDTIAGCLKIRSEIERASGLVVNGLASNAHLIDETGPRHILDGCRFAARLADETGLPLHFITTPAGLIDQLEAEDSQNEIDCPVLAIRRQLLPPWRKAGPLFVVK